MTTAVQVPRLGWTPRRRVAAGGAIAVVWAALRAGLHRDIVNGGGWSSFARFWTAVTSPEVGGEFLRLTWDAATITLSYAVLGSLLSFLLGGIAALALSELIVGRGTRWRLMRATLIVPRAVHEVLWALLLVQVFGFGPLSAVLAIAIPFAAVSAKVFAETFDVADRQPFDLLRATGATRLQALIYGVLPTVRGELVSYGFYRFECAIRTAAVLGVIGVGGLGFQLDLSFETLRYHEIWTLIVALMLLSGGAEALSTAVRRARKPAIPRVAVALIFVLVPLSIRWTGLDVSRLWSARTAELATKLIDRLFPSRLGPGGWSELVAASVDTIAMSLLAIALSAGAGLILAAILHTSPHRPLHGLARVTIRTLLLLGRAVPSPIWAFLFLLVLFPGMWPGAVGLAAYNTGVLGRLFAEALEEADPAPGEALAALGASATSCFFYGLLPTSAPRLMALTMYRWEVIARETIVVGVVGAGGLGRLITEHLAARDFAAVTGAIGAMIVIAVIIDSVSAATRRALG